jgi:hypothetical protein
LPGVAGLEHEYDQLDGSIIDRSGKDPAFAIPQDERSLVAPCRAWCLAEINAAMKHGKPLVVKAGSAAGGAVAAARYFVADAAMLQTMQFLIDVKNADATVPADLDMILGWVRAEPGGTAAMDLRIASRMRLAHALAKLPRAVAAAIDASSCGEPARMQLMDVDELTEALPVVAKAGHVTAVKVLLAAGADTRAANTAGKTGWFLAAENDQGEVLTVLAAEGRADLEARESSVYKKTALMVAASKGNTAAVRALVEAGANLNAVSACSEFVPDSRTALMFAEINNHSEVASILRDAAAAKVAAAAAAGSSSGLGLERSVE